MYTELNWKPTVGPNSPPKMKPDLNMVLQNDCLGWTICLSLVRNLYPSEGVSHVFVWITAAEEISFQKHPLPCWSPPNSLKLHKTSTALSARCGYMAFLATSMKFHPMPQQALSTPRLKVFHQRRAWYVTEAPNRGFRTEVKFVERPCLQGFRIFSWTCTVCYVTVLMYECTSVHIHFCLSEPGFDISCFRNLSSCYSAENCETLKQSANHLRNQTS